MPARAPTRERLVTEAMRLFSQRGFDATSVAQIEDAAGLSVGAGALYRHFKSKEALLDAGVDRQLDRRQAMRDIRSMFAGVGDMHTELALLGRYLLNIIDDEAELLQTAARTATGRSQRLNNAYAALIDGLNTELAEWITSWAPTISPDDIRDLATLGINALLGARFAATPLRDVDNQMPDERYLSVWTATLGGRIQTLR